MSEGAGVGVLDAALYFPAQPPAAEEHQPHGGGGHTRRPPLHPHRPQQPASVGGGNCGGCVSGLAVVVEGGDPGVEGGGEAVAVGDGGDGGGEAAVLTDGGCVLVPVEEDGGHQLAGGEDGVGHSALVEHGRLPLVERALLLQADGAGGHDGHSLGQTGLMKPSGQRGQLKGVVLLCLEVGGALALEGARVGDGLPEAAGGEELAAAVVETAAARWRRVRPSTGGRLRAIAGTCGVPPAPAAWHGGGRLHPPTASAGRASASIPPSRLALLPLLASPPTHPPASLAAPPPPPPRASTPG